MPLAPPRGGRIGAPSGPVRSRTYAQLEATERIKHQECSFRTSKDYGAKEVEHLQRLFEDIGRPRFSYTRGDRDYEEHLEKYAYRHIQIFHRRRLAEVKDRVDHCLKYNRFHEVDEAGYWAHVSKARQGPSASAPLPSMFSGGAASVDPTKGRAPAWVLGSRLEARAETPPPGPAQGGSEPYDYRSIGKQVSSEKVDPGNVPFTRAGAAGTSLTIAEQIALLTPTPTTYTPKVDYTIERVKAYPWARNDNAEGIRPQAISAGPGSYEATSMRGPQHDSKRRSDQMYSIPKRWTGRLPRELEPVKEKYGAADPPPPPPLLPKLQPS